MTHVRAGLLGAITTVALCGCAPHVKIASRATIQSTDWSVATADTVSQATIEAQGWSAFASPELERLIQQALLHSPEIGMAIARVDQAQARLQVTRSALLPTLGLAIDGQSRTLGLRGAGSRDDAVSAGLNLAYDLDVSGERRAGSRADQARLLAANYDAENTRLLVASSVAQAYFQYLALVEREVIIERAIANATELERIIQIRFEEGVATRVDLGLQQIEVRNLRSDKTDLVEARAETRNALAVLVGEEAMQFRPGTRSLRLFAIPDVVTVQPAALLVRRPDVRDAEAQLMAADGDIAAARRAFLPSVPISIGMDAGAIGLGNPVTAGINVAASILAPIFSGNRLRGNLEGAAALQRELAELYRLRILNAVAETENALTKVEQSAIRRQLLDQIVAEARLTAELAREQYVSGAVDARTALEAERELLAAEEKLILTYRDSLEAVVEIHRAIGGRPEGSRKAPMAVNSAPEPLAEVRAELAKTTIAYQIVY